MMLLSQGLTVASIRLPVPMEQMVEFAFQGEKWQLSIKARDTWHVDRRRMGQGAEARIPRAIRAAHSLTHPLGMHIDRTWHWPVVKSDLTDGN